MLLLHVDLGMQLHVHVGHIHMLQDYIKLFSKVDAPFYTHISVQVFLFLYIFTKFY